MIVYLDSLSFIHYFSAFQCLQWNCWNE